MSLLLDGRLKLMGSRRLGPYLWKSISTIVILQIIK